MFKVSVIIPVYNAVEFIRAAVESIVNQEHVAEVILVDDGFPANSFDVCKQLEKQYDRVKAYQHPNGENRGAGASRNLGISKSSAPYIAFLDADDYCLPERFKVTKDRFQNDPTIDGVYEPIGTDYKNEEARQLFMKWKGLSFEGSQDYVTYTSTEPSGIDFFRSLLHGNHGYPSIIGITVKKELFQSVGFFDTSLRLHQDTDLIIRMAFEGYFVAGSKTHLVANRVVHAENRIATLNYRSRYQLMKKLYHWSLNEALPPDAAILLKKNYNIARIRYLFNSNSTFVKVVYHIINRFQ